MARSVFKLGEKNANPAWWGVDEVRNVVFGNQISRNTIYNLCRAGDIPFKKFGMKMFIPNSWVQYQLQQGNQITFCDSGIDNFKGSNGDGVSAQT